MIMDNNNLNRILRLSISNFCSLFNSCSSCPFGDDECELCPLDLVGENPNDFCTLIHAYNMIQDFLDEDDEDDEDDSVDSNDIAALYNSDSRVNHPSHYTQGDIECIDAMVSAFGREQVSHYCLINAFKYVWRNQEKNGLEDIEKAQWYLAKYTELTKQDESDQELIEKALKQMLEVNKHDNIKCTY